jgi:hypothetical protein
LILIFPGFIPLFLSCGLEPFLMDENLTATSAGSKPRGAAGCHREAGASNRIGPALK